MNDGDEKLFGECLKFVKLTFFKILTKNT